MGCHWNVMTLDVTFWHLFWSKKTSKFYGHVMTFWLDSTGFLWEKDIPVKCHEIPVSFKGIKNFGSFWRYFDGKIPWNCHGIWGHFRPKLWWESMMAFYYEGMYVYLIKRLPNFPPFFSFVLKAEILNIFPFGDS